MTKKKISEASPVDEERFNDLGPKPPEQDKGEWTYIVFVLDRSGSMQPRRDTAVEGFNKFLADQQKQPGWAEFTLLLFNTGFDLPYSGVQLSKAKPLDVETYVPDGGTALFDALGKSITDTKVHIQNMDKEDRPAKVLFAILTDGEENSSTHHSKSQISAMIKAQQESGWVFCFLAATEAGFAEAASLGVAKGSTFAYKATQYGTATAFSAVSNLSSCLRSSKGISPQALVGSMHADTQAQLDQEEPGDVPPAASVSALGKRVAGSSPGWAKVIAGLAQSLPKVPSSSCPACKKGKKSK